MLQALLFRGSGVSVKAKEVVSCQVVHDIHNLRVNFNNDNVGSEPSVAGNELSVSSVSRWHWGMMNDERRNGLYQVHIP